MADFTKIAKTVKRLIDANGRSVTLIKQGVTEADGTKPWRSDPAPAAESVTGIGVFVSTEPGKLGAQWFNPTNLKRGDQVLFFAALDDDGKELQEFDTVTDSLDGAVWKIVHTQLLSPGLTKLLYQFQVRR